MDTRKLYDFVIVAENGCWNWKRALNNKGYAVCNVAGRQALAHRTSYEHSNGRIPDGLFVLHKCDNPKCINPDHLFLGTQIDNMQDCKAKGRASKPPRMGPNTRHNPVRGSKNKSAKINEAIAKHIMLERMKGRNFTDLGHEVGLDPSVVADICKGNAWAHVLGVDGAPTLKELAAVPVCYNWTDPAKRRAKVDALRETVVEMIRDGNSARTIMAATGVTKPTFYRIWRGDR